MSRRGYCSVVGYACKAPAGVRTGMGGVAKLPQGLLRKDPCSVCGGDVCTSCSTRTKKDGVVCNHCKEDDRDHYEVKKVNEDGSIEIGVKGDGDAVGESEEQ
jgi:hypothetical protein